MCAARRVIAHLDCDAFFATVELLRRPELRGLPVIVAGNGPRSVVTTASYEARRFGVGSAMPARRALELCPDAVVIPPDGAAYRETSRRVWDLVAARIERLQQVGIDEAFVDLSGEPRPVRLLRAVVAEVKETTGIQISVGMGPSRLVAKCCSDVGKPAGFVAMSREEACRRFAPASVRRIPGIGPKSALRLSNLGIVTIGDLQDANHDVLREVFGHRWADEIHRRAHFYDDSPVVTEREPSKSVSREVTFDEDVADLHTLERTLEELSRGVVERADGRAFDARTVSIKVRLADWTTVTRSRTLDAPVDGPEAIHDTARDLLRAYAPPSPVRLLGVRLSSFVSRSTKTPGAAAEGPQMILPVR